MRPRLLALRRASAIVLVLWTALLVATFLERRFRQAPQTGQVEVESPAKDDEGQPVRVHKGFVYSDTLGIEPNFRIAAREAVEFSSGWYEFSDVQVSLYHEGRVAYGLVADRLKFDPASHEAETSGRAEVSLQGGVALRAAGFKFGGTGRLLQSRGPATFAGPGWGGLAGGARCSLENDTLELTGGTSVSWRGSGAGSEPSLILLAPRLLYDRKVATIEFPEGLTVLRGRMRARTARAEFQLSGPEGELRTATMNGPVRLDGVLDDGSNVDAAAGTTVIESLPAGRYRLTADPAADTGWVSVKLADRTSGWRDFTAWRLVGEGSRTAWEWLEGQGLACASDLAGDTDPRRLAADRMRLVFDKGQASTVVATDRVRIETGDQWADGGELQFALATRTFVLRPEAGKRVALGAPGSRSWCDRLEGAEGGNVVARGQVTGALERAAAPGKTGTPVRFAAASATASDGGAHLTLEGDARLWQGDRLVRADRLDYDRASDVVTGEGGVLTTAKSAPNGGKSGAGRDPGAASCVTTGPQAWPPTRATSFSTTPRHEASCQRLVATLDDQRRLVLANLDGGVTVRDRPAPGSDGPEGPHVGCRGALRDLGEARARQGAGREPGQGRSPRVEPRLEHRRRPRRGRQSERDALPSAPSRRPTPGPPHGEEAIETPRLEAREIWSSATASGRSSTAFPSRWPGARSSACWGPTAPARRRRSTCWSGSSSRTPGACGSASEDVTALPMYRRARLGISYLPQEASVFRRLTVEENLFGVLELLGVGWQDAVGQGHRAAGGVRARKAPHADGPRRFRAASDGASRSPGRWSPSRGSSSWTSRSPASTRSRCSTSSGSSATCGTGATAS